MVSTLSDSRIEEIRDKTEWLLEHAGFVVESEEVLQIAAKAGAVVDEQKYLIQLPVKLQRELLAQAPSRFAIAGLDGREHIRGGEQRGFSAIVTDPWVVDYATQCPRRPALEDVRRNTIIGQKLERVVQMSRMDFPVTDFSGPDSSLRALETHLLHQNKHIMCMPASLESYREFKDIAAILADGDDPGARNLLSVAVAVISPFKVSRWNAEMLLDACRSGYVIATTICPMAGTTAPYTKAAVLLQGNVENVFMIALTQMIRPGTPISYGFGASVTDMQDGHDRYYMLDSALWTDAIARLARSYAVPTSAACGGGMGYRYDLQQGIEGMLFMDAAFSTGVDLFTGIGSYYNAIGMSSEMMVIHNALYEIAEHMNQGIDFSDFNAAAESLAAGGPGAHFLTDDLTLKNLRSDEFLQHPMTDLSGGSFDGMSLLERAHAEVERLTADAESPLPGSVQEQLKRHFSRLYRKLGE